MTLKRFIIALLSIPLLSYWLVLSPVAPSINDEHTFYIYSDNRNWKVGIYRVSPTTPISLIQYFLQRKYIVLYDKDSNYITQNSPFCLQSFEDFNVVFPIHTNFINTKDYVYFMPEECVYTLSTTKSNWWSKIIKFRLSL